MPPPDGIWGMPPDMLRTLPGYDPDVKKSLTEARALMEGLGYGPNNRLHVKLVTRDLPDFRDNAVILIDQLKEIYINGELSPIDTTSCFRRCSAATIRSPAASLRAPPTIPTRNFTVATLAALRSTMPAIATVSLSGSSISNRWSRPGETQALGVGDRSEIAGGRCQDDRRSLSRRNVLATPGQGTEDDGQQRLQRLADGRRLLDK
jgi:hypothetical protein